MESQNNNTNAPGFDVFSILYRAILAGMFIGVGGIAWLICESKYVGSLLFCIGLFTICRNSLWLFTGKIGYLVTLRNKVFIKQLALTWLGNLIGAMLLAAIASTANKHIVDLAGKIVENRLAQNAAQTLALSMLCGMLMYVAVDAFKQDKTIAGILLGIPTFLLCGFEHSIADMFFFAAARIFSFAAIAQIICVSIGNAIGSIIVCMVVGKDD
ncbi:MAG: formate/nitrite transporter family protein [Victivallales bacterium]|nr:formate/nitrite transporter family protein [Victivallales bacterium]